MQQVQQHPLLIQRRVIFALFARELKTRFGKWRLGYAWAVLEPAAHIVVLTIIFSFGFRYSPPGIDFPVFLTTGIVPFLLFSHCLSSGMKAVDSNRGMFNYRFVKPIDTVIARILLEAFVSFGAYICLLTIMGVFLGYDVPVNNIVGIVSVFAIFVPLCFAAGLIACVLGCLFPETQKALPLINRPLYFVSGIFFTTERLPEELLTYLLWNPLLHVIELQRAAFFPNFVTIGTSYQYLFGFTLVSLALALALYRAYRYRLVTL
ncbi:MAG: ABC transporter permease [Opitutales bacterium]|nr:ABC transporter permease [Opitutales bacterium]